MLHSRLRRVERPAASHCQGPELQRFRQDRACRWSAGVLVAHQEHDGRAAEKQGGWKDERQPKADVFLRVHHADLAGESANIDHQVEVHVNTGDGHGRVDNDALTVFLYLDVLFRVLGFILLSNQRRDVGFKASGPDSKNDQTNGETSDGTVGVGNDGRNGSHDDDDMADNGDEDGDLDGFVAAPVLIGHVGTD